jgi:hypothetical protein
MVVLTNGCEMSSKTKESISARSARDRYTIGGPASRADSAAIPMFGETRNATALAETGDRSLSARTP